MTHPTVPARSRWLSTMLALFLVSLVLGACGGASQPSTAAMSGAWVGKVEGTDAFIGIASNGEEAMVYVCDGKTITQWFHGPAGSNGLDLSAGSARLETQLATDSATGSITLADGRAVEFQAARAAGDAGLYRSEETVDAEKWTAGWVVLNDGQLRGLRASSTGTLEPQSSLKAGAGRIEPDAKPY